jgi:hypothetical protein
MDHDRVWVTASGCPLSDCSGTMVPIGPYLGEGVDKPDGVECTNGHRFPVLEQDTSSAGQTRWRLGPQSNAA